MKKIITGILLITVLFSAGLCADAATNTMNASTFGHRLMYPYFDFWSGAHVKITGNDGIYPTNDAEITKLLSNNQKGGEYLDSYYFKNTAGVLIDTVAIGCGVWVCVDAAIYQVQNDKPGIPFNFKDITLMTVFIAGALIGPFMQIDGLNDLCKSINEYNLSISCVKGTGAIIGKDTKF
jgi:hypothetical protein